MIPITVLGGYLGAGKTTLLNSLLHQSSGRRIGVIVNDFGELGVDAELIADALRDQGSDPSSGDVEPGPVPTIVNLANGCVCCTLGDDLRSELEAMSRVEPALDAIVVEASGVADPATTAAWGTVAPFAPGGVVVLVAADTVSAKIRDRYVGGEVQRQIVGADLVVLTKTDRCDDASRAAARSLVGELTDAPVVTAVNGDLDVDLVLGPDASLRADATPLPSSAATAAFDGHDVVYERWSLRSDDEVDLDALRRFVTGLPPGVLRAKGVATLPGAPHRRAIVNVVGSTVDVAERPSDGGLPGLRIEIISRAGAGANAVLDDLAADHLA